ncbi:hypothetical protein ACJ6WE_17255 [Streptomyces sp. MMS24-I31]
MPWPPRDVLAAAARASAAQCRSEPPYDPEGAGGYVDGCEVSPMHSRLAQRAQQALRLPLVGFGLILCEGRPIIVDEITFPGLHPDLFAAAGRSLGHELFALVSDLVREHPAVLAGARQDRTTVWTDAG